jgi:hypothetical protein
MFASINENFISAIVEGALMMSGQYVDLSALQDAAAMSRDDILPMGQDV